MVRVLDFGGDHERIGCGELIMKMLPRLVILFYNMDSIKNIIKFMVY